MRLRYSAIINNRWMRVSEGVMWRDVVPLTLGALLLGAAIMANISDGPLRTAVRG